MVTTSDLITSGYFPRELPPPFNTKDLGTHLTTILSNLQGHRVSKLVSFDIPKVKLARRHLGIPNPLQQIKLSQVIETNWAQIQAHYSKSNVSASVPVHTPSGKRAVATTFSFGELPVERALRSPGSRILLKTDISRYYPSIYTHSIPWALHTKSTAKRTRGNSLFGNLIDESVRNSQDGQTMGIPIGPDTSLIVSEIIGSELDHLLQLEIPNLKGFRYVDDYYLYFENVSDAEIACAKMTNILKSFELDPNTVKTSITHLPEILEKKWALELRLYDIRENQKAQKRDIISYFSKAFEYSLEFPSDAVLKYALKRSRSFKISYDNWPLYESLILRAMIDEPSVLPTAAQILLSYQQAGYTLAMTKITETIYDLIKYHSRYRHTFEVAWALWIAKSLNISIPDYIADMVSEFDNSVIALIALDLRDSGLISRLKTTLWRNYMTVTNLSEEQWLLTYEAHIKGWLNLASGSTAFGANQFFNTLKSNNVQFYDKTATVSTFIPPYLNGGNISFEDVLERLIEKTGLEKTDIAKSDNLNYDMLFPYIEY
ncbi:MAG TPA: RNA-directed DNA polymerase [Candidatus Bathyarchaeia archaeon]|nr:RNA-directed DNA polymerase [Candidatus Bathyarchaeia archaeon]